MSVPNQIPYNIYTANGLTTVFAYEFYLISASDIQVTINGSVATSGYTVSGVGNTGGGEVTFLTAPANGATVIFERVTPTYRLTDYQDNGDLLADTVNKDFDRLWMAIQRAFIYLGVALTRPLFGGGSFNANGYRISNLADPIDAQDAATKKFVVDYGRVNLARTLRVPEANITTLPSASNRRNKILAFNNSGDPIAVLPESGSAADVLIELSHKGGSGLIGNPNTGTVDQGLFFIIPQGVGDDVADDTAAVQDAINRCKNGMLVIPPGKKYRCKNLVIPHPMTIWSHGRREDTWLSPYGNDGDFVHSGNFIQITTSGTVTFFNVTIEARHRTLTFEDGKRLNGVHGGGNTTGVYQSGFNMYNSSVSGFSGFNIVGGSSKSFGIMKDCQSESSGLSCLMVRGVDWRIDHCYIGRSRERHGIEIYGQSNAITNCDIYFNYRDGIAYEVSTGAVLIDIIGNVVNGNGENGIRVSGPYNQPAGTKISSNKLFNNSKNTDGAFSNIVLSYGRGHQVFGNIHFEYSANTEPDGSPRCGFCLNLLNGATLSGPLSDAIDPLYSYRSGAINVNTQSLFNQNGYTIGSYVDFAKGLSNDTRIAFSVKLNNEGYDRVKIGAGKIFLGNGVSEPSHGIQQLAAYPGVTVGIRSLGVMGDYSDSVLRIGGHRVWSGGDGTMRTKWNANGSSATDGGIISSRVDVPPSHSSPGIPGQYAVDSAYRYDCVSQNTWVRTPVTSW